MSPPCTSAAPPRPPSTRTRGCDPGARPPFGAWALLVALLPASALAASLSVEGGPVVLGRTGSATLLLDVGDADPPDGRPLRLAVNVGTLGAVERVAPGRHRIAYTPPATRHPQVALLGWWRDGWGAPPEVLRLPLLGTTRLPVKAPAGRTVSAEVGDQRFGPVQAGRDRTAVVPIVVPPGIDSVTVTIAGGAAPVTRVVALEVPPAAPPLTVPGDDEEPAAPPAAQEPEPVAAAAPPPPLAAPAAAPAAPGAALPPALHLGVRGGFTHSLGALGAARLGLDAWRPFRLGPARLGVGVAAGYGEAAQAVSDGAGTLESRSEATFVPVTLRAGWEAWAGRRLTATLGAGATATFARFTNTLGPAATGVGFGGLGFAALGLRVGPGQLFADASLGTAPVAAGGFRLEAGGLALDLGYRVRLR